MSQLRSILHRAEELPRQDIESISILIDAGELTVALENLCTQIYEYDVDVRPSDRTVLERLGRVFRVPVASLLGDPGAPL